MDKTPKENNPVKICLVSMVTGTRSGQFSSIVSLAIGLQDRGHKVDIITPYYQGPVGQIEWAQEDKKNANPFKQAHRSYIRILKTWRQYDLVQVHLHTPAFSIFADFLCLFIRRPLIVLFELSLVRMTKHVFKQMRMFPKFFLMRFLVNNSLWARLSPKLASGYVVSSEFQKRELLSVWFPEKKITVIRNMSQQYIEQDKGAKTHTKVSGNGVIGYAGHNFLNKGIDILLKAMSIVLRKYPQTKLVMAFSGLADLNYEQYVRDLIKDLDLEDNIEIKGKVNILEFLYEIDVLAIPNRFNFSTMCFPNLALEAYGIGTPIVANNIEIMQELNEEDAVAFICENESPQDYAGGLIKVLEEPRLFDKRSDASHREKIQRSIERSMARFVSMYQRVLTEDAGKREYYSSPQCADQYDEARFGGRSGQWVNEQEVKAISELIPENTQSILDFPCGTGRVLNKLKKKYLNNGTHLYGADISLPMIHVSKQGVNGGQIGYVCADVSHMPFKEKFDVVVSSRFVFHFKDLAQVLAPMAQALRKGGYLIFDTQRRSLKSRMPFFKNSFLGQVYIHSDQKVEEVARQLGLRVEARKSFFLFSTVIYRYLPFAIVRMCEKLEEKLPERLRFKVCWKLIKV